MLFRSMAAVIGTTILALGLMQPLTTPAAAASCAAGTLSAADTTAKVYTLDADPNSGTCTSGSATSSTPSLRLEISKTTNSEFKVYAKAQNFIVDPNLNGISNLGCYDPGLNCVENSGDTESTVTCPADTSCLVEFSIYFTADLRADGNVLITKTSTGATINVYYNFFDATNASINLALLHKPSIETRAGAPVTANLIPVVIDDPEAVAPYQYSISPALPAGLSFTNGVITGTPTTASPTSIYEVTVVDGNGLTGKASFALTVVPSLANKPIVTVNLPNLELVTGTAIATTPPLVPISGSGGSGTLTYYIQPDMPANTGLSFNSATGALTGTPQNADIYSNATNFTVSVTDEQLNSSSTEYFSLTIYAPVSASTNQSYASHTVVASTQITAFSPVAGSGGVGNLRYSITPALPSGLTLDAASGTISGQPAAVAGNTLYTVKVSDSSSDTANPNHSATATFSLAVTSGQKTDQTITFNPLPNTSSNRKPFTISATASSGLAVSFSTSSTSCAVSTQSGTTTVQIIQAGNCTITADQAGNATFNAATPVSLSFTITDPTITITAADSLILNGQQNLPLSASSSYGDPVTLSSNTGTYCTVNGSPGNYTLTPQVVGTCTLQAATSDSTSYFGTSTTKDITIYALLAASASTTIPNLTVGTSVTAFSPVNVTSGNAPYTFQMKAGSTLPGGLTLNSIGTITGKPTAASSGSYVITVHDATLPTAQSLDVSFPLTVNLVPATALSLSASGGISKVGVQSGKNTLTVSDSGGSGSGAISYSSRDANCTVSANSPDSSATVTGKSGGTCRVYAIKAADATYQQAQSPDLTLTILAAPTASAINQGSLTLMAGTPISTPFPPVTGTGTNITYSITPALPQGLSFATANGTLSGTPAASQAATSYTVTVKDELNQTASASFSLTIMGQTQSPLSATANPDTILVNAIASIQTSGGSGSGGLSFEVSENPAVCSVNGSGAVTGLAGGTCTVTVTKAADGTYAAATADVIITVLQPQQNFTVSSPVANLAIGSTTTLQTSGGSGTGTLSFQTTSAACSVNGSTGEVTGVTTGACTVTANKAASGFYAAASADVSITIVTAGQAPLILSATPAAIKVNETTTLSTTGGSGTGAVSYRLESGPCSLSGATLTATGLGTCAVTATKAASGIYAAATSNTLTLTINQQINPLTTERDLASAVTQQVQSSVMLASTQAANITQRLDFLRLGGARPAFSAQGFALLPQDSPDVVWITSMTKRREQAQAMKPSESDPTGVVADPAPAVAAAQLRLAGSDDEMLIDATRSPVAAWINGTVTYGKQANASTSGKDGFTTAGVTIGSDYDTGQGLVMGVALGYGEARNDIGTDGSRSNARTFSATLYGNIQTGENSFIDMAAGYGYGQFDLRRWSAGGNTMLSRERNASQLFASLRLLQDIDFGHGLLITPSVRLEALRMMLDGYTEEGAPAWALSYDKMSTRTLAGVPGIEARWITHLGTATLTPSARMEYRHAFTGSYRQSFAYANVPNGARYSLEEQGNSDDSVLLGLGLTAAGSTGWSLDVGYDLTSSMNTDALRSQSLQATYRQAF